MKRDDVLNSKIPWNQIDGINDNLMWIDRINSYLNKEFIEPSKSREIDLFTLLIILKERKCKINIPEYIRTQKIRQHTDLIKKSDDRSGEILELVSNQNTFNFSVRIANEMYMDSKSNEFVPRSYTITDYDGSIRENWKKFEFKPTDIEIKYLDKHIQDYTIKTDKFINKQLAQAFYSEQYMLFKILIERLIQEKKYLGYLIRNAKDILNINEKKNDIINGDVILENKKEEKDLQKIEIIAFESKLVDEKYSNFIFDYIKSKNQQDILKESLEYLNGINSKLTQLRFFTRAIECAFCMSNPYKEDLKPTDFKTYGRVDCKWDEQKVKYPRSRIEWNLLHAGEYEIVCRYYKKTITRKIEEIE